MADFLSFQKPLADMFFNRNQSTDTPSYALVPNFCCLKCLRVVSAMTGNPPLRRCPATGHERLVI